MKTIMTKNLLPVGMAFMLLFGGMFSASHLHAQNCPSNKVWACRYDECGIQECKCVHANQVQNWTATIPPCNLFHPNCCNGWRIGQNEPGMGINASLQMNPNPVSNSAVISFSLSQAQNVSLRIYDMSGRLISTLSDKILEEGDNEMVWIAENVNQGIYFLQLQSEGNSQTIKVSVTK